MTSIPAPQQGKISGPATLERPGPDRSCREGPMSKVYSAPTSVCSVPTCDRLAVTRGWCGLHYGRWRAHGDPEHTMRRPPARRPQRICSVEDCSTPATKGEWCQAHYRRWKLYGDLNVTRKTPSREAQTYLQNALATFDRSTCWEWPYRKSAGYGSVSYAAISWRTKLTDDDVRAIRADTRRHADIAAAYGMKIGAIRAIRYRQCWKHV